MKSCIALAKLFLLLGAIAVMTMLLIWLCVWFWAMLFPRPIAQTYERPELDLVWFQGHTYVVTKEGGITLAPEVKE